MGLYWSVQLASGKLQDGRFDENNFQNLPSWLVKQVLASYRSSVNTEQLSQARLAMMTANINRGENTPAYEDIGVFLPYPSQYLIDNTSIPFKLNKRVVSEFMGSYEKFDAEVEVAFTPWLQIFRAILIKD